MKKNIWLLLIWLLNINLLFANNYSQTQSKIKQLDNKITHIKSSIDTQKAQSISIKQNLILTNKKINTYTYNIKQINNNINKIEKENNKIIAEITNLEEKKTAQSKLLADHIKTEYALRKIRANIVAPTKNKKTNSHLVQYYKALLKERCDIVKDLLITKESLQQKKMLFVKQEEDLLQQKSLLNQKQKTLFALQNSQANSIQKIQRNMSTQEQILNSYKRDRENLSKLLIYLVHKSTVSPSLGVKFLQKKLPKPLQDPILGTVTLNQGVIFLAPRNNNVYAISPGKIVFSDWFNGYGKLIIIDHGRGFMTLYGHNNTLLKPVGTYVNSGTKIATIGNTSEFKKNGLYFEIRQQGRAIPPRRWLS